MPELDVILPVFNAAPTLKGAVRSILRQTHRDLRLIAIDDGSTDDSLKILRDISDERMMVVVNDRNLGLPETLNRGVAIAEAPFVARMDADDISHPSRLEKQIGALKASPELDLLGTAVVCMDSQDHLVGQRVFPSSHEEIVSNPYRSIPMAHPTWCGRREWFVAHPYDPRDVRCEDQALLRRALDRSRYANLNEPLLAYREATAVRPRATLRARRHVARNILSCSRSRGHLPAGLLGAGGVLARWSLDLLVWLAGNPRAAFHRFQPLDADRGREWYAILEDMPGVGRCTRPNGPEE